MRPTPRARGQGRALPSFPGILFLWRVRLGAFFRQVPPLPLNTTDIRYNRSVSILRIINSWPPNQIFSKRKKE